MGAVAGQLDVVVVRVVGLALGREVEAVAGREVGAVTGRVVGVAEARGLGEPLAVGAVACLPLRVCGPQASLRPVAGAHPASCACNHFWQVLNMAVAQILDIIIIITTYYYITTYR
jgi:hypothetical protein